MKSLSFCPDNNLDQFEILKDLHSARKLKLKTYNKKQSTNNINNEDQDVNALEDPISLLEDQD